jgi:hypothetical protein
MTDFSSKGLLPQLTDVLEAFAESHERLLLRIQGLRAEHSRSGAAGAGEFSSLADGSHGAQQTERRTIAPIEGLAAGHDQHESARDQLQTTPVESIPTRHAHEVETESADRNYNFFDELDDHLARLDQDPPSDPVED